jgi:hypothetical protein
MMTGEWVGCEQIVVDDDRTSSLLVLQIMTVVFEGEQINTNTHTGILHTFDAF